MVVTILSLHQPKDLVTAISAILTWELESRDVLVRHQLPSVTPLVIRHSPGNVIGAATEALLFSVTMRSEVPRQDRAAVARDAGQPWLG